MSLTTSVTWGATVQRDSQTRLRLGYLFSQSPATITSSTGQVTVTAKIYAQTWNRMWDYMAPLSWSGSYGTGSATIRFETSNDNNSWADNNIVLLKTLTRTVTASEASTIKTSISASFRLASSISSSAKVSGSWTTAKKPIAIYTPYAPTAVTWETLTSTGKGTARITPNTSSARPYRETFFQLWDGSILQTDDGAAGALTQIGYDYFKPNRIYRWAVAGYNSAGTSAWTYSPWAYTVPAPPTSVKVKANPDNSVTLTWAKPAGAPTHSAYKPSYRIVWRQDSGAWLYDQSVYTTALTWTHTGLNPEIEYEYAIQTAGNVGTTYELQSEWTGHTKVRLSSPPLTPKVIGPTEGQPSSTQVSLHFEHNPQDGSEQTGYELEWWTDKDTTVRRVVQTASAWNKVVITTPAGDDRVRWRVRTKGIHPDFSPWTSTQMFGVSVRPTVTMLTAPGPHWGTSPDLRAAWLYTDSTGTAATKYEVRTTDVSGKVLQEYAGMTSTPSGSTAWSGSVPDIEDGQTLTVAVRVADSYGVFSEWATATVTADYAEPPVPLVTATFDEATGTALVTVTPGEGEPTSDLLELFRYAGNGLWERSAQGPGTGFTWTDPNPLYGDGTHNLYAARASTWYPSYTLSEVTLLRVVPEGCDEWFWLSSVKYPERRARFRGNPAVTDTAGVQGESVHHYGDRFPTAYTTLLTDRKLSVSGRLDREATRWQDWLDLAMTEGTFVYRDPAGRCLHVRLEPMSVDMSVSGYEPISFSLDVVRGEDPDVIGLEVPSNVLTETSASLYAIEEGTGQTLTEDGGNLYVLNSRPDARMSLIEEGHNLYLLVDWDNPTVEWCRASDS